MKTNLLIFIIYLNSLLIYGQSYVINYSQTINIDNPIETSFDLYLIDETKSFYQQKTKGANESANTTTSEKGSTINFILETPPISIYTDWKSKKIWIDDYIDNKNHIVAENLYPFNWEITSETKQISNYKCIKAKAKFRGREYEAWFTEEISTQLGPWKINGLPGLILELYDTNHYILIQAKKISKGDLKKEQISIINKIQKTKAISHKEYNELNKKHLQELLNQLSTKLPDGLPPLIFENNCKDCQQLEIYEEWEE